MKARTIGLSAASLAIGAITGFGIYGLSGAAFAETNSTTTPTTPTTPAASAPAQSGGSQSEQGQSGNSQSGKTQSGTSGTTDQKDQNGECGPRDGKGRGGSQDTPVTGAEATKVMDAVKAKDSAFTPTSVRKDPDGSYDVLGAKNGQQVMYDVSTDLKTITEGGHR